MSQELILEDIVQEEEAEAEAPAEEAAPAEAVDASGVEELNILWAQWDPADYLQEIGNMYEEETGIVVNVVQEPDNTVGAVDRAWSEVKGMYK